MDEELLAEISQWLRQGVQWSDIIQRLRPRTVPPGYIFTSWRPGKLSLTITLTITVLCNLRVFPTILCPSAFYYSLCIGKGETEVDMLRSILSQIHFTWVVRKYDDEGIPFRTQFHVPEVHPDTNEIFFRERGRGTCFEGVYCINSALLHMFIDFL